MAAGTTSVAPFAAGEIRERPDDGDNALPLARMGEGIDQIVPVQLLPRLLRADGDGGSGGKLVAGAVGT